ncbi:helix-turn-helix domain-containing protein [Empedobacter brevis]|uniref:helix-turn-helix domain-containing protein n=1 Tax=Empedobacter brevis TaxID=247 RepID=UPI003341ECE8
MKFQSILILILSISINGYAQNNISPKIEQLSKKKDKGAEDSFLIGQEMLKISQNDCERAKAYLRMGDAKCKNMQYAESIKYLKKADLLISKCNLIEDYFNINFFLMLNYQELDLKDDFNKSWKIVKEIAVKMNDPEKTFMIMQANALFNEKNRNYSEAIVYRKQISDYVEKLLESDPTDLNRLYLVMAYTQLCYVYLKDNHVPEAQYYYGKIPALSEGISKEDNYLLDIQYLVKAMLLAENHQLKEAREWFDQALLIAIQKKYPSTIAKISEERLHYGIDNKTERQKLLNVIIKINKEKLKESDKYSSTELEKKKKETSKVHHQLRNSIIVGSILLAATVVIFVINRKSKKRLKIKFEKIIADLQQKKNADSTNIFPVATTENNTQASKSELQISKIMSVEKEKELLQKLMLFEEGTEYTSKNFTFSNFISALETNSKYANYIVKQHRGKSFNDYINGLRIQYIIEKLYNHPEYLNYKISYLAEISGFSTHSRFAQIFKSVTEISPSKFIQQLVNAQEKK